MTSPSKASERDNELLEIARQAAIRALLLNYRELPPAAIKVYLACIDKASLKMEAELPALSARPSLRALATICNFSKATVQTAIKALTLAGLLVNNRPVLPERSLSVALPVRTETASATAAKPTPPPQTTPPATPLPSPSPSAPPPVSSSLPAPRLPLTTKELRQVDDDILIAGYQGGNQDAFAELYRRHFDNVQMHVGHYLSESASYDVAQQIFIELMKKLKNFRLDGSAKFTTWLHRFTELALANARRKNRREVQLIADSSKHDIKTVIRLTSPQQQILPYMLSLDEVQQHCVYLHYYEGLTYEDIAEQLGIDAKIVRNYLQTARRHIRASLENQLDAVQDARVEPLKFNEYFYAAMEREKQQADETGNIFTFCLISGRLRDADELEGEVIITVLGRMLINQIPRNGNQIFHLGNGMFALLLNGSSSHSANQLIKTIRNELCRELPALLACSILQYDRRMPTDAFINRAYLKLLMAQKQGDTTLIA